MVEAGHQTAPAADPDFAASIDCTSMPWSACSGIGQQGAEQRGWRHWQKCPWASLPFDLKQVWLELPHQISASSVVDSSFAAGHTVGLEPRHIHHYPVLVGPRVMVLKDRWL